MYWIDHQTPTSINTLLENESITLAELLDQDDILSECQASNKKLIEFLVRPNVIHELIQLITEEPSVSLELRYRYRHSAIACDIITSRIPSFSENMAGNTEALGKLYSFVDSDPPLNPLLASFFAKTIQVFFAHSTAHQDWYTYQVMCLQVIEFFKSCPAFLPNLLKHIGTSAIMTSLQYITQVSVDDMKQDILQWLNCEGLIENLVDIICGANVPQKIRATVPIFNDASSHNSEDSKADDVFLKANETQSAVEECTAGMKSLHLVEQTDASETSESKDESASPAEVRDVTDGKPSEESDVPKSNTIESRLITNRCKNAADLMCFFIQNGRDNSLNGIYVVNPLLNKCTSEETIKGLLDTMFAAPPNIKKHAVVCGIQVLMSLLNDFSGQPDVRTAHQAEIHRIAAFLLPWLPHFKQIMTDPVLQSSPYQNNSPGRHVGIARLTVAQFFTTLVSTDTQEVSGAIIQNGIVDLLLDMFLEYKWNNFLHDCVETFINKAMNTSTLRDTYRKHILVDCKLMARIVNAWNENDEIQKDNKPRCGYMGHMIQIANHVQECLKTSPEIAEQVPDNEQKLWDELVTEKLEAVNTLHNTCLGGGQHPSTVNASAQEILELQEQFSLENSHSNPHDVNFNDNDTYNAPDDMLDDIADSKDDFEAMCENQAGSIGDFFNDSSDKWTNANIKDLTVESSHEKRMKDPQAEDWLSRENLLRCLDETLDEMFSASANLALKSTSPWGDISNFPEDQAGWADFGNLQETAGISKVPNDFTCEAFAAFDHGNNGTPNLCRLPDTIMNSSSDLSILRDGDKDSCDRKTSDEPASVRFPEEVSDSKQDGIIFTALPSVVTCETESSNRSEVGKMNYPSCTISSAGTLSFADIVRQQTPPVKEIHQQPQIVEKNLVNNSEIIKETVHTEELAVSDVDASSENKNVTECNVQPAMRSPEDALLSLPDNCLTSSSSQDDNANPASTPASENPSPNLSIDNQR